MKADASAIIGQVFNSMYRITRPIGVGGMGAVYEAVHTRLANKRFAVKMLHAAIAQDAEVFQRFRREAEIATELGHPNIVEVTDFNITPDGSPYMVMELLDGEDLAKRLQVRGPMTLDAMARIIVEVCSGLEAAHGAGIVHRDLKPQNIFLCKKLGRDDFVKIVDFGISKVKDSSSLVTRDHSLMGTPFYMSPEQADGLVQQIDHRTDIFALGAIMWEMLTGRMAFEAPTISGAMYKVVHVDAPEVHTLRPDVPVSVSHVLRRAMGKQKDWRYNSVTELANDFLNACRGYNPAAAPQPVLGHAATMAPPSFTPPPMTPSPGLQATPPPRAMTPIPATSAPPPHSQPGGLARPQDAFAATGFITPPPGALGASPPMSQPPMPLSQPGFGHVPATAMPHTPLSSPPPQLATPPGLMTPPSGMGAPSTLNQGAGQMIAAGTGAGATSAGPAKKGKGALYGAIGAVALLGVGAAVAIPMMGGDDGGDKTTIKAGGDGPKLTDDGDKPGPSPSPSPSASPSPSEKPAVVLAGPPDAGVAVASGPVTPSVVEVTITFDVQYEKGKAPGKPATKILVGGKPVVGGKLTVPKGKDPLKVDVTESGYKSASITVVADADKTVPVVLKKKSTGTGGPDMGKIWIPD